MSSVAYNIIVLVLLCLLVTGAGVYVTIYEQPGEIERLEKAEKVARLRQAEVTSLLAEENTSSKVAQEAVRKWQARYKLIPRELSSANIVAYINDKTRRGFKNFDISFEGSKGTKDFRYHTVRITGRGYYSNLYKFVWEVENSREFNRIRDLNLEQIDLVEEHPETGNPKHEVMVSFTMKMDAYYGGASGLSAGADVGGSLEESMLPTSATASDLPPVPMSVLPDRRPDINPFYPLILDNVPPNTYDLPDMEDMQFVSIVGGKAVFQDGDDYVSLGVGDPVYLGQITRIDAQAGVVVARLNRGGIIDEIEMKLETGDLFRQALGPVKLAPVDQ